MRKTITAIAIILPLLSAAQDAPRPESVAPLMTTAWGQDAPYNNLCPEYAPGRHCKTSCVATAMAQVMRYHRYPARGIGKKSIQWKYGSLSETLTADFAATEYQWDLMLDSYTGQYTDAQADAVATIMYQCGIAADVEYTPASGAYIDDAFRAAIDHFGYARESVIADREYFDDEVWAELVMDAIAAGYPVYYGGYTSSYLGHAFVIDGYDRRGYVHVNWGFGSSSDGYYPLSGLKPYVYGQSAMLFYPAKPESGQSWMVCSSNGVSVDGGEVSREDGVLKVNIDLRNYTGYAPSVSFGLRLVNGKGDVSYLSGQRLRMPDNRYVALEGFTVDASWIDVEEGAFEATPVYRLTASDPWQPVKLTRTGVPASFTLTVTSAALFPSMSRIDEVESDMSDIQVINRCIYVFEPQREINIYNIHGHSVGKLDSRRLQSPVLPTGVYIVTDGMRTAKIAL